MHNKIIWLNLKIGYKRHFFHLLNWFPVVWEGSHITVLGGKHGGWGRFQDHPRHKLTQHDGVVGRRQVMCCYRVLGRRVHHYHRKHVQKSSSDTCTHYLSSFLNSVHMVLNNCQYSDNQFLPEQVWKHCEVWGWGVAFSHFLEIDNFPRMNVPTTIIKPATARKQEIVSHTL